MLGAVAPLAPQTQTASSTLTTLLDYLLLSTFDYDLHAWSDHTFANEEVYLLSGKLWTFERLTTPGAYSIFSILHTGSVRV